MVALATGGCGGGDADTTNSGRADAAVAEQRVRDYFAAFGRGDGPAACALLTPQARAGVRSLSDRITAPDCAGAVRELARVSARLRSPRITVEVNGGQAVAKVRNRRPPYESEVLLREQDGAWLIAFPPALLERFRTPPGIPSEEHGRG
jgi:hypothetical protein